MLFNSIEFAIFLPIIFLIYWKVFPNRSIRQPRSQPTVPKLSIDNKTPSSEYYESKLELKDMTIRDLKEVIDKQNEWLDYDKQTIKDLKELYKNILKKKIFLYGCVKQVMDIVMILTMELLQQKMLRI